MRSFIFKNLKYLPPLSATPMTSEVIMFFQKITIRRLASKPSSTMRVFIGSIVSLVKVFVFVFVNYDGFLLADIVHAEMEY